MRLPRSTFRRLSPVNKRPDGGTPGRSPSSQDRPQPTSPRKPGPLLSGLPPQRHRRSARRGYYLGNDNEDPAPSQVATMPGPRRINSVLGSPGRRRRCRRPSHRRWCSVSRDVSCRGRQIRNRQCEMHDGAQRVPGEMVNTQDSDWITDMRVTGRNWGLSGAGHHWPRCFTYIERMAGRISCDSAGDPEGTLPGVFPEGLRKLYPTSDRQRLHRGDGSLRVWAKGRPDRVTLGMAPVHVQITDSGGQYCEPDAPTDQHSSRPP